MESRLELAGAFTVDQVPEVRRFVERLHAHHENPELIARVSVATHELFENAVKFSCDGTCAIRIGIDHDAGHVQITTRNRATVDDLLELRDLAAQLARATDMLTFYLDLMRHSPRERDGGLGIGRVAAESEARIELTFEDDVVVVTAELPLVA
jgi:hypothetical protein